MSVLEFTHRDFNIKVKKSFCFQIPFRSINNVGIAILATILWKEKLTPANLTGICLSIIGVITCVQPWLSNHNVNKEYEVATNNVHEGNRNKNFLGPRYLYLNKIDILEALISNETNVTKALPNLADDGGPSEMFGYMMAVVAGISISFGSILIMFRLQDVSPSHINVYCGAMRTIVPLIISLSTQNLTFPTEDWDTVYLFGQVTCLRL